MNGPTRGFRLPAKTAPGQAVRAADYNALVDILGGLLSELRAGSLSPSPTIGVRRGPNGTSLFQKRLPGGRRLVDFEVHALRRVEDIWKVNIAPGYLSTSNPKSSADPVYSYAVPEIGGIPLDAEEPPSLEVEVGQTVYLKLQTDSKDQPTGPPEIVAAEPDLAGTHYQPPPAAVPGVYYYPLADIVAGVGEDAPPKLEKQRHSGGPIIHTPGLWEGENVGGGAGEVYKERAAAADKYLFRTIKNVGEAGKPILKPLPAPLAVSHIPLRSIKGLGGTGEQIKVLAADEDNEIQIRGNGYSAALTGLIAQLGVTDGLVTAAALATAGYTGSIKVIWRFNPASGSPVNNILRLTFSNGRLITVGLDAVDGSTDVSGVSNIEFFMTATDTAS
jgi:hypothetical protein